MSRKLTPSSIARHHDLNRFLFARSISKVEAAQTQLALTLYAGTTKISVLHGSYSSRMVKCPATMVPEAAECCLELTFYLHAYSVERVILVP